MNTTFTIEIKAPELAHAIETLAIAIGCTTDKLGLGEAIKEAVAQAPVANIPNYLVNQEITQQPVQQIVQQIPMQQIPVQQVPIQQIPVTPQTPVQQMPVQNVQAPVQQVVQQQQPMPQQQVPTQVQSYTMDQLAVAATQLMDAGKRNDLVNLLGQFNVPALTTLPKDQYGAFVTALRGMGAKI